jgi:uncharacterized membrane protein (UPF0127 family)
LGTPQYRNSRRRVQAAVFKTGNQLKKQSFSPKLTPMTGLRILVLSGLLALTGGCDKPVPSAPPPGAATQAQPKLRTLKLWLGAEEMTTELALTPSELQTGMMFRTNMAENEGMIFVFARPHQASFWMMNTLLPLSAAYIGPDGTILEIHDLQPHDTNSVTAGTDQVQFVLETKQGWFRRHNVNPGSVIRTERGSLHDTFIRNP